MGQGHVYGPGMRTPPGMGQGIRCQGSPLAACPGKLTCPRSRLPPRPPLRGVQTGLPLAVAGRGYRGAAVAT